MTRATCCSGRYEMRSFSANTYGGSTDVSSDAGCVAADMVSRRPFRRSPRYMGWTYLRDEGAQHDLQARCNRFDDCTVDSRRHPSVISALGEIVIDFLRGPFQRFALGTFALGAIDFVDGGLIDATVCDF